MFREPIGSYMVGVMEMDTNEIGEGKRKRRLPLTFFYPSDEKGRRMPYQSAWYLEQLKDHKMPSGDVDTHCDREVPLSTKQARYPVIVYSHGLDGYTMDSTVLCTDLASLGYIVCSVGHPIGAAMVRYQDNTFASGWRDMLGEDKKCSTLKLIPMLLGSFPIRTAGKREDAFMKYCSQYATITRELVPIWQEDLIAAMDELERLEQESSFFGHHLEICQGFSLIGLSLGGNAAVMTSFADQRVNSAINLDGALWTAMQQPKRRPPILVMCRAINSFSNLGLRANKYQPLTIVKQHGLSHWEYSDGIYLSDKGKKNPDWAGRVSRERAEICAKFIG